MRIDGYERPIDLVAALTIRDEEIAVDFSGTSGVSTYGINVPLTYTQAYASFGVRCVIGGAVPNNAGSLAPVIITAPKGSILNAPHPCAVTARHVIGQMLPDVVLGCLNQVIPDRVPAEGTSCLWNPVLLGGHGLTDEDYGDATPFAINTFHAGGTGARPDKDGLNATAFPSGVRNTPIEVNETIAPLVIWRKEYRPDSGGAGKFRGGVGQVMEISHSEDAPFAINCMFDRVTYPARGRNGGGNGEAGIIERKVKGDRLNAKGRQPIGKGDRLVVSMPGGGGLGNAFERDPAEVARDVVLGFVSPDAARSVYGVAVDEDGRIDEDRTRDLRAAR
jgi:N-methylhydantoinase B